MKTLSVGSNGKIRMPLVAWLIILVLVFGGITGCALVNNADKLLTDNLSAPLGGATTAKFDINTGTGNLTVDRLATGEQVLASGTLQYFENLGLPTRTLASKDGQATLTLKWGDSGAPCTGAIEWLIHLNPNVTSDITAHSGGGNVKLNLSNMVITRVAADTGGGNMDVVLPDSAANLNVTAKTGGGNVTVELGGSTSGSNIINANSGAGNVVVRIPSGLAARIQATSGLGKVTVDSRFSKIDGNTYQSPDYDDAANKVEITANSGAGNVEVNTK
jgi:hypothetical protein